MSLLESLRAAENRPARLFFAAAAGALFLSLASAAIPAGAQTECHAELSFDSVHLLNNGQNDTAGPFSIDIDAGTYTIIVESFDDHDAQVGIGTQPEEQFYLVLDSGYRSPATNDIADDQNSVTTTFTGQVIDASSSLVLDHARLGGVNSVWPRSVCFVQEVPADIAPAVDCTTAPDAVVGEDDVEAIEHNEAVADVGVDGCDDAEVVDCSAADAAAVGDAANIEIVVDDALDDNDVAVDGCDDAEVGPVGDCTTADADERDADARDDAANEGDAGDVDAADVCGDDAVELVDCSAVDAAAAVDGDVDDGAVDEDPVVDGNAVDNDAGDVAVAVDGCDEAEVVDCSAADAAADGDAANNETVVDDAVDNDVAVDGCDEAEAGPVADCTTTGVDDDADKVGVAEGDADEGDADEGVAGDVDVADSCADDAVELVDCSAVDAAVDAAAVGDAANNEIVVDDAVEDTAHADVAATTCDDADEETAGDATAEGPAPEVIIVEVPGVTPDPIVIEVDGAAPAAEVIVVEVPGVVPDPIVIEVPAPAPDAEVVIVEAAAPVVEAPMVDAAAREDEAETSPAADVVAAAPVDEPAVSDVIIVEAAAPVVEAPVGDTAVNTDAAASPTAGDVAVEVAGVVEVAVPEGQVAAAQTDSSAGPAIAAVAQTDVGGDVLAITGSDAWKLLVMMAIVLMAAGVLCMRWGRVI